MAWNCLTTQERLSDHLDGLLGAEDRAALETHSQSCAACRELVARVGALVEGMHRLEEIEPPARLIERILQQTGRGEEKSKEKTRWGWMAPLFQPRMVLGAVTVFATMLIVLQSVGLDLRHLSMADLNPLSVIRATNRQAHLTYARSVKFVNDLRVVYEIQSRLQGQPETPQTPAPSDRNGKPPDQTPRSDRQLKNHLDLSRAPEFTAQIFPLMPGRNF
jgi:hypothetical protein